MNADLEQIFACIEKGNVLSDEKKYWEAAKAYTEARRQLLTLTEQNSNDNDEAAEAAQIRQLYRSQARDYLHRARSTLVEALKQEDAADMALKLDQPTRHEQFATTDKDDVNNGKEDDDDDNGESLERIKLFAWLFANEQSLHVATEATATATETTAPEEQQSSLEDRLRALNASLPQSVKSSDERMRELNKSLRHLGIAVPSSSTPKSNLFEVGAPKSEFDQVADIINQVKDEARMQELHPDNKEEISSTMEAGTSSSKVDISDAADKLVDSMMDAVQAAKSLQTDGDDNDDDDDPEGSDEDDGDDGGANPFMADDLAYFQDRVNEAQTSLAELNAMLERDQDDAAEDVGLLFDPDTGKHALDSALRYLQQVQKRWKEAKKRS